MTQILEHITDPPTPTHIPIPVLDLTPAVLVLHTPTPVPYLTPIVLMSELPHVPESLLRIPLIKLAPPPRVSTRELTHLPRVTCKHPPSLSSKSVRNIISRLHDPYIHLNRPPQLRC